ncbi:MAG TPA: hypothetical protein VD789_12720 [Thermomicrobiales bacterium]|nr:hypothetical protein [Thermomicrobiales bacterium]
MRAHFHLLSGEQRRESGGGRADRQRSSFDPNNDFDTGRPGLTDLPSICGASRIQLDLARPDYSVAWLAERVMRERVGFLRGSVRMRVARRRGGKLVAAAAFRVIGADLRWQLEALTARDPEDGAALDAVLRRAVSDAGADGARRVFARLPGDIATDGALRRSGFVPFATESVYMLADEERPSPAVQSPLVRRVHPADVWGVHQLYLEVVPRQVQYAEAVTSRAWERSKPLKPGLRRASGWVIEDRGRIRGYARVSTEEDPRIVRLDLLIDPKLRVLASDLIRAAVSEASNLHGLPCVAAVPGYSHELHQPLQDAGFIHVGDQTAWVCYTTVPARSYIVAVDLGSPATIEPQRARVPGFGGAGMTVIEYPAGVESHGRRAIVEEQGRHN